MSIIGSVAGIAAPEAWTDGALCPQIGDPELWFPDGGTHGTVAKQICHRCPVRAECLEFAFRTNQRYGIYGGFTDHERDRLRRRENPLPRPARESYVPRKANGHPIACKCCRRAS